MKFLAISFALIVGASCQIYTQIGPDGYKYRPPQQRLNLPEVEIVEAIQEVKLDCPDGGSGPFCCTNGADNADCLIPTPPPLPSFLPTPPALPKIIPVQPLAQRGFFADEAIAAKPAIPKINVEVTTSLNEYLPPNDYLPPSAVVARLTEGSNDWDTWKAKYNKRYASIEEDNNRREIFEDNVRRIVAHNKEFDAGSVTFDLDVNKFCDQTQDEFVTLNTGLRRDRRSTEGQNTLNIFMPSQSLEAEVEDEVDWRKKGAVTKVKNQGNCASCWAFAANGAMEAQNFLKSGKLVSLSEQNLIDCVKENDGCDSGYMTHAYEYVRTNPGVDTEESYPYEAKNATCRFDPANVGGECIAYMEIQEGNEVALRQAVAMVGPVAAGIDASKHSFQFYKSGVLFEPSCTQDVNHAVLIVGYGKADDGQEYWICKNSWDSDWGLDGYALMARNKNNHCGITSLASYPLV